MVSKIAENYLSQNIYKRLYIKEPNEIDKQLFEKCEFLSDFINFKMMEIKEF